MSSLQQLRPVFDCCYNVGDLFPPQENDIIIIHLVVGGNRWSRTSSSSGQPGNKGSEGGHLFQLCGSHVISCLAP